MSTAMIPIRPAVSLADSSVTAEYISNAAAQPRTTVDSGWTVMQQAVPQVRYRQYEDEPLDPRIADAQVRGSNLIATLDGIPVTIALPEKVVDAYNQGALPLGKLANAVLERCDRLQQIDDARERFEQESRTETRGITQR